MINIAGFNACGIPAINNGANPPVITTPAGTPYKLVSGNGTNLNNIDPCTISVTVTDLKLYICRAHVANAYVPNNGIKTMVSI